MKTQSLFLSPKCDAHSFAGRLQASLSNCTDAHQPSFTASAICPQPRGKTHRTSSRTADWRSKSASAHIAFSSCPIPRISCGERCPAKSTIRRPDDWPPGMLHGRSGSRGWTRSLDLLLLGRLRLVQGQMDSEKVCRIIPLSRCVMLPLTPSVCNVFVYCLYYCNR